MKANPWSPSKWAIIWQLLAAGINQKVCAAWCLTLIYKKKRLCGGQAFDNCWRNPIQPWSSNAKSRLPEIHTSEKTPTLVAVTLQLPSCREPKAVHTEVTIGAASPDIVHSPWCSTWFYITSYGRYIAYMCVFVFQLFLFALSSGTLWVSMCFAFTYLCYWSRRPLL